MKYIALLRGINVGGNHKVGMKKLKAFFESLGYTNVATYINSGNVIFESKTNQKHIASELLNKLKKEFGFDIPTLIKTAKEMKKIANAIPKSWKNDQNQRTDVAYLFPEIDSKNTIDDLPIKKELADIRYVKGAIYWNVKRKDVIKSHLTKIIGHPLYRSMTIRNVNTARYLAGQ